MPSSGQSDAVTHRAIDQLLDEIGAFLRYFHGRIVDATPRKWLSESCNEFWYRPLEGEVRLHRIESDLYRNILNNVCASIAPLDEDLSVDAIDAALKKAVKV